MKNVDKSGDALKESYPQYVDKIVYPHFFAE